MNSHDLQQIKGIGPTYAQKLADAGIVTLEDLARATPEQLHEIVHARGRTANYDAWIQQARELIAASGEAPEAAAPSAEEATPAAEEASEEEAPSPAEEAAPVTEEAPEEQAEEAPQAEGELHAELQDLVEELNNLAAELKRLAPQFQPPPYTPQRMKILLAENLDRFAPETVKGLQESLEGATLDDFKDFETWKGVWFTINYLIKLEASERGHALAERLAHLPGVSTLADLKEMLKDTPPEEFLNPETWKGAWFLINYELKHVASDLKNRLVGGATQEEDDWDDETWDDDWNEDDWE